MLGGIERFVERTGLLDQHDRDAILDGIDQLRLTADQYFRRGVVILEHALALGAHEDVQQFLERAGAAGILSVSRNAAMAAAPLFAGLTLAVPALGLPFVISGGLKIVYDVAIFSVFRKVRPPEEAARDRKLATSGPDPR